MGVYHSEYLSENNDDYAFCMHNNMMIQGIKMT
jgi:hypothetical protein